MTEEIKEKLLEEIQHLYKVYMHDPDLLPEFAYAILDLINQSKREYCKGIIGEDEDLPKATKEGTYDYDATTEGIVRNELSKILIKWHMQTNQAAINEIMALLQQSNREYGNTLIGGNEKNTFKVATISWRNRNTRNQLRAELRKKNENT